MKYLNTTYPFFLIILILTSISCNTQDSSQKPSTDSVNSLTTNIILTEPTNDIKGLISGNFGGCGYNYTPSQTTIELYEPGQRELNQIYSILKFAGLSSNFIVYSAPIDNAIATIINNKRYILYDPKLLAFSDQQSGGYWSSMSILAHEIGHHLSGHTITNKGSNPSDELDADKFSGSILYKMGASLPQATAAIQALGSEQDSYSHPSKYKRIQAITKGWNDASQQRYESAIPPPPSDEDNNKAFWGKEEFTKADLICPLALADETYGGLIDKNNYPLLEGVIVDITKGDASNNSKAEFCNTEKSNFNMVVTIQLTKVLPSSSAGDSRKIGQREKFNLIDYNHMSDASLSAFEAIMIPGRKVAFRSFYFGYGAEDIFYLKKLNRQNNNLAISENKGTENTYANYLVISQKSFFYSQPNFGSKRKVYLVSGELIQVTQIEDGFAYTNFINALGKASSGWILLSDLSKR